MALLKVKDHRIVEVSFIANEVHISFMAQIVEISDLSIVTHNNAFEVRIQSFMAIFFKLCEAYGLDPVERNLLLKIIIL